MISSYDQDLHCLYLERSSLHELEKQLKEKMDVLDQQHARISEALRERRSIISPIQRLPSELLCKIFLATLEQTHSDTNPVIRNVASVGNSPWSVSGVSARWRSVALSFQQLWSSVNISITDDNFRDDTYSLCLCLQLNRSQTYPLSMSICVDRTKSTAENLPIQLITILSSSSARIRELSLDLPVILLSKLPALQLSLPLLEILTLLGSSDGDLVGYPRMRLFLFTPNLRSVEMIDIKNPQQNFDFPWNLLKQCKSEHSRGRYWANVSQPHHHLNLLRELKEVEECVLRIGRASADIEFRQNFPLVCSRVRVLELSSWISDYDVFNFVSIFQQVLNRLTLPVLFPL